MQEASETAAHAAAQAHLRALAGPAAELREDQWTAISALIRPPDPVAARALVVQRTGWGKSAVYFVATALLRAAGAGPTVIVSPLLSLMRNQVAAAERAGIRAATVNSSNAAEWQEVYAAVGAGEVDVLLVSPERLNNPGFRDEVLPLLAATAGLVVVDEAHCISDWGHDFRPDYRRIATLLAELPAGTPVLATTATANARVIADVADQLGSQTLVLRGPLNRASLRLSVVSLPSPAHRLAWLAEQLPLLPGSGIVYTLTVAATEQVADYLREQGIDAVAYSGRTEDADRQAAEEDLLANRVKALVATSALGMGFDKADLGFVVHLGAPPSPIAYYQQIGRAGRGVARADVVLLPGEEDEAIWRYFGSLAFPSSAQVSDTLAALDAEHPRSVASLETAVDLRRTRLEAMLKVLDVDGAVRRVKGGWVRTGQPWTYDEERYARVSAARLAEQQAMRDYAVTDGCRMEFLLRQLDDPGAAPCGRCDRCTGVQLTGQVAAETLTAARTVLERPGVPIEPRRMWPGDLAALGLELRGRIPAQELAESGRALCRLSDVGWGNRVREVLNARDPALDERLRAGLVQVLAAWEWVERPSAVAVIPSRSRPELVRSMGQQLADLGRLELLGELVDRAAPQARGHNSAQRLLAVHDRFAVPQSWDVEDRTVLLVDDRTDTGWTLTAAARLLRLRGAAHVLPLVLAVEG